MALASALERIQSEIGIRLSNYGEFLSKHPPEVEVQIVPASSWSCYHGVERWRGNCGCNSGRAGWNQEWRGPLRDALDFLRDRAAAIFESKGAELLHKPWDARNDYINVILDRSPENLWIFFEKHSRRQLRPEETSCALQLLEMQRHAMLMYTSCGWFFDEISGIETVQVLQYAGRVMQLAEQTSGEQLEAEFLKILSRAQSNIPEHGDGAQVYEKFVNPAVVDLCKVGAYFAISAMFDGHHEAPKFCYDISTRDYRRLESGVARLGIGRARVSSKITRETRQLTFAGIHMGDQVLHAGVRDSDGEQEYVALAGEAIASFTAGDFPEVLRILDKYFGEMQYSLRSLFKDEQNRIIGIILQQTLEDAEASYHRVYQRHGPLLRFLKEMGQPVPDVLRITAEFVLNSDLEKTFSSDPVDSVRISMLLELVKREGVQVEEAAVGYAASNALTRMLKAIQATPGKTELLQQANVLASILEMLPFKVNTWDAQNIFFSLLQTEFPSISRLEDQVSRSWTEAFTALGEKLDVSVLPANSHAELRLAG